MGFIEISQVNLSPIYRAGLAPHCRGHHEHYGKVKHKHVHLEVSQSAPLPLRHRPPDRGTMNATVR